MRVSNHLASDVVFLHIQLTECNVEACAHLLASKTCKNALDTCNLDNVHAKLFCDDLAVNSSQQT